MLTPLTCSCPTLRGGSGKRTAAEKRAYIRDERPRGLSIERGCALMELPRSTYYATPQEKPSDAELVTEIRAITDEANATAIAASVPSSATAVMSSTPRKSAG
jgi:hypothetical protein